MQCSIWQSGQAVIARIDEFGGLAECAPWLWADCCVTSPGLHQLSQIMLRNLFSCIVTIQVLSIYGPVHQALCFCDPLKSSLALSKGNKTLPCLAEQDCSDERHVFIEKPYSDVIVFCLN